jgi:hypothetical protein
MPNDCYNRLILRSNDNTKIEEAIAAFKAGKLLNYFVPQPADLDQTSILDLMEPPDGDGPPRIVATPEQLAKARDPDWLKWRVEHWGTKWDIYDQGRYRRTKTAVEFDFHTAWSPPLDAYEAAVKVHGFELEADYDEPGMGFGGCYFPKYRFRLSYQCGDYDDDGQHFPFIAQSGL